MHKITVIIVLTWNVIITNYYCCFDLFTWRHYYSYVITHFEILATVVFPKCSHHNESPKTLFLQIILLWLHTRLHVLA